MDDADLIKRTAALLTAGRWCNLKCELSGGAVIERGRVKYWSRFLRVIDAEFPQRAAKTEIPAEAASAP